MLEVEGDGDETGEAKMCGTGVVESVVVVVVLPRAEEAEAMLRGARGGREAKGSKDGLEETDGGLN